MRTHKEIEYLIFILIYSYLLRFFIIYYFLKYFHILLSFGDSLYVLRQHQLCYTEKSRNLVAP